MNTSLTRRSILAATSLVLAAGLALGACGGSSDTSTKKKDQLLNAGLQAEVQGDYATAKKNFEELLKSDPTNKFAHYNLGYIAQTQDRDGTEATKQYEAALKTDPEYGPALYNLAIIKTANGDDAGAILLYQR